MNCVKLEAKTTINSMVKQGETIVKSLMLDKKLLREILSNISAVYKWLSHFKKGQDDGKDKVLNG